MTGIDLDTLEPEYKGELKVIPVREADTYALVFECEIMEPPSSKGKTIYVYFQDEDVTDALKALRDEAIKARSKPMEGA